MLSEETISHWQQLLAQASSFPDWTAYHQKRDQQRVGDRKGLLELLDNYLGGRIDTEAFRQTFDQRTRTDWPSFGLKGMSGAMFLNKLVKHIPDPQMLTTQLQLAIKKPNTIEDGHVQMKQFMNFLDDMMARYDIARNDLQPARAPFFLSAWWHLQDFDEWPIYYISARNVFRQEGLFVPVNNLVSDYFTYRDLYFELARALNLSIWDLEHLCALQGRSSDQKDDTQSSAISEQLPDVSQDVDEEITHSQVQALLANIGAKLGCKIWIASNDRNRVWEGQRLGDLSLDQLPNLGLDTHTQRIIELIDVVWLTGARQIAAAFEFERTTSIYSGLLRLSDLVASSPNLNFPLYIVAPENKIEKVRQELLRPAFRALELHERCGFFSDEELKATAPHIMQWADNPDVIERLAHYINETDEETW